MVSGRLIWDVFASDICLLIRKLLGCRINFNHLSVIDPGATVRTKERNGRITIGSKVAIRKNSEVISTGGHIKFGSRCFCE